jgi:elongation factor Ts
MSAQITSGLIKELRERTGVGIGKCKEALEKTNGDMEEAISYLRKIGIATAVKKEGRTANEGMIGYAEGPDCYAILEVNAETDFVVRNDRFQEFLKNMAEEVVATKPSGLEEFLKQPYSKEQGLTIDEYRATIVQAIGENIQIRRMATIAKSNDKSVGIYSHLGGKILTTIELSGTNGQEDFAKDIAMHVAAAKPDYLSPEAVPQDIVEREQEIAKTQMQGKPANVIDKIIEGKIKAFYDEVCLVKQKYIKDDSISIEDLVAKRSKEIGKPLQIANYTYWAVGQG